MSVTSFSDIGSRVVVIIARTLELLAKRKKLYKPYTIHVHSSRWLSDPVDRLVAASAVIALRLTNKIR